MGLWQDNKLTVAVLSASRARIQTDRTVGWQSDLLRGPNLLTARTELAEVEYALNRISVPNRRTAGTRQEGVKLTRLSNSEAIACANSVLRPN